MNTKGSSQIFSDKTTTTTVADLEGLQRQNQSSQHYHKIANRSLPPFDRWSDKHPPFAPGDSLPHFQLLETSCQESLSQSQNGELVLTDERKNSRFLIRVGGDGDIGRGGALNREFSSWAGSREAGNRKFGNLGASSSFCSPSPQISDRAFFDHPDVGGSAADRRSNVWATRLQNHPEEHIDAYRFPETQRATSRERPESSNRFSSDQRPEPPLSRDSHMTGRASSFDNNPEPSTSPEWTAELNNAKKIWRGYLWGQLANVGKAALWWSVFGVLVLSLLDSPIAIAATRGPFNLALLISSPFAVAAAERVAMKRILIITTAGRFVIWSVLIPVGWVLIYNKWGAVQLFWELIVALMFIDGVQVAFSNAVDIDCGGLDSLSQQYTLPLTDFLRYKFNTIHQLVFDSSFVFLTPPVVLFLCWISRKFIFQKPWTDVDAGDLDDSVRWLRVEGKTTLVLVCGMSIVFGALSLTSLFFYIKKIPSPDVTRASRLPQPQASLGSSYRAKLGEVKDGLFLVLRDSPLKWRLILLAMETALEDAMVSVVIPMIAINGTAKVLNSPDKTVAAVAAVVAIAVGKLGGVLAGMFMATRWVTPQVISVDSPYRILFTLIFLSSVSLVLLPWGYELMETHFAKQPIMLSNGFDVQSSVPTLFDSFSLRQDDNLAIPDFGDLVVSNFSDPSIKLVSDALTSATNFNPRALSSLVTGIRAFTLNPPLFAGPAAMLSGIFLFFVLSTAPKIGFASLIQSLIAQDEVATKVFGFVGLFVTITDGIVITLTNLIFFYCGWARFRLALWVLFGAYLVHGLMEFFLGPWLILEGATPDDEELLVDDETIFFDRRTVQR